MSYNNYPHRIAVVRDAVITDEQVAIFLANGFGHCNYDSGAGVLIYCGGLHLVAIEASAELEDYLSDCLKDFPETTAADYVFDSVDDAITALGLDT